MNIMILYFYQFYFGVWKTVVTTDPHEFDDLVEAVWVQEIHMPANATNTAWLANQSLDNSRDHASRSLCDVPGGVVLLRPKEVRAFV